MGPALPVHSRAQERRSGSRFESFFCCRSQESCSRPEKSLSRHSPSNQWMLDRGRGRFRLITKTTSHQPTRSKTSRSCRNHSIAESLAEPDGRIRRAPEQRDAIEPSWEKQPVFFRSPSNIALKYIRPRGFVKCFLAEPATRRSYPTKITLASKSMQFVLSPQDAGSTRSMTEAAFVALFRSPLPTVTQSDDRKQVRCARQPPP